MFNVAHVTNDVKWRPIVTTFGTLIENMSMTAIYFRFVCDDFMSNINCGIGVFHVKRQILTYFVCDVISVLLQVLLFHLIGHRKRCIQENIENFLWLSFCDMTVQKATYRPCDLDLWKSMLFQLIYNDPISVLYEFQIDISTNSWEIKYQNMGIGRLHVKRRTRQKWRPIVTKFGTLIENMSRTGLYDLPYFLDFYWQFYEN